MGIRKDHAEHNERLSHRVVDEKVFLDWASTIAFYSALHFVSEKILPGTYNNIECNKIFDAAKALNCQSKHEATMEMVNIKLPAIANKYKFLMVSSFTNRYNNYDVDIHHSKLCQKFLKEIKEHCYPA